MSKLHRIKKIARFGIHAVLAPQDAKRVIKQVKNKRLENQQRLKEYIDWYEDQRPKADELDRQRLQAAKFKYRPLISIIVPLYNTPEIFLRDCIPSVQAQTYDNWELCFADDASPDANVSRIVQEHSANNPNIKLVTLKKNQHIVGASNKAIELAEGEFIALLDHDDLLTPDALFENVKALNTDKTLDLIYSDEDKVDESGVQPSRQEEAVSDRCAAQSVILP